MVEKRVLIVDFNHMAHTYYNSQFKPTIRVIQNGVPVLKETTIQNGTIKAIHRWSNGGVNPTAVCFDRPVACRKSFFEQSFPEMKKGTDNEYKGGRARMSSDMMEGIEDTERIFKNSGVSVFSAMNYESDDLIQACVKRAKEKYPGMPIDVVTNDADLLPLVDDTVSVFFRSRKGTYAESEEYSKLHYIQVTPRNYSEVIEDLSSYRGFTIPYNSILLHKLLRGDSADKIGRKDISRMFSPKKYNAMIEEMIKDGVDFESVFRYDEPKYKILYRGSDEEFKGTLEEALKSPDRTKLYQKVCNPAKLDEIIALLSKYSDLNTEQLGVVEKLYWGMNLNQAYPSTDPMISRRPYVLNEKGHGDINPFNEIELQKMASALKINIIR